MPRAESQRHPCVIGQAYVHIQGIALNVTE